MDKIITLKYFFGYEGIYRYLQFGKVYMKKVKEAFFSGRLLVL